jgi:cytoskeletal protein CcmA (bactofilin family)
MGVILVAGILMLGGAPAAVAATSAPHSDGVAAAVDDRGGPQFYSGALIDVSGTVDGDVYAAGQSVTISGDVTGDVIAAAQTITVTGHVDGNVRLAGQDVSITGEVTRSGTVFAANLTVGGTGSVGDDIVAAAGTVSIAGDVGRDVMVSVGRLVIDGSVGGSVTYMSDDDALIADRAVDGTVERVAPPQTPRVEVSPWAVFIGWFLGVFYALVALSIITLLAGLLFPRWLQRVTDHLVPSPWKALLVGFVASIAVPPALLFLAITIIGAPLALAGLLVWILLLLATFVYSAHYIGRLVLRRAQHPVITSVVGGVILIVALQIPWLNILVWLAMVFFGLGAQLLEFHRQRPWRLTTEPAVAPALPPDAISDPQQPASATTAPPQAAAD